MTITTREPVECLQTMQPGQFGIVQEGYAGLEKGALILMLDVDKTRTNAKNIAAEWLVINSGRVGDFSVQHVGYDAYVLREATVRILPSGSVVSISISDVRS